MLLIGEYLNEFKRLSRRGRCLHFAAGSRCDRIIGAHSIQNAGQLSLIEEGGHVIQVSADLSLMRKNNGNPGWARVGVNRASTFPGFCGKHDNELFESIDNQALVPNDHQVFLYAYRCVCREYFVKENAANLMGEFTKSKQLPDGLGELVMASGIGHSIGFESLKEHKRRYDESLERAAYSDIQYVCFLSDDPWSIQLSGLLYPDYDFYGQCLQDIADPSVTPALITYFTAPVGGGWAFVFAWHRSSSDICRQFLSSLAGHCRHGKSPADALLRMTFSCCENHAIRPSWWAKLKEEHRISITERASLMMDPAVPVPANYLCSGLEDIADWNFENVHSTM